VCDMQYLLTLRERWLGEVRQGWMDSLNCSRVVIKTFRPRLKDRVERLCDEMFVYQASIKCGS